MSLQVRKIVAINDETASATSGLIWVGDFEKVGILMRRSNHSSGSSAFTFSGGFGENAGESPTMTALNTLIDNVTNSNTQNITLVNGKTLSANGDAFLWVHPSTPITHIRAVVVETTDGTHRCEIFGFERSDD